MIWTLPVIVYYIVKKEKHHWDYLHKINLVLENVKWISFFTIPVHKYFICHFRRTILLHLTNEVLFYVEWKSRCKEKCACNGNWKSVPLNTCTKRSLMHLLSANVSMEMCNKQRFAKFDLRSCLHCIEMFLVIFKVNFAVYRFLRLSYSYGLNIWMELRSAIIIGMIC